VLLGSGGRHLEEEAVAGAGIAGFLTKPVRQSRLHDCLVGALGQRPARAAVSPPSPSAPVRERSRARPRVLVVENNSVNQKVAALIIEKLGYGVDVAGDGNEAMTALDLFPYAAVVECPTAEMPEAIDETIVDEEREDGLLLGDRPLSQSSEAEHLEEDLDARLMGTSDVQKAIEEGMPWNPPQGPTPEGISGQEGEPPNFGERH